MTKYEYMRGPRSDSASGEYGLRLCGSAISAIRRTCGIVQGRLSPGAEGAAFVHAARAAQASTIKTAWRIADQSFPSATLSDLGSLLRPKVEECCEIQGEPVERDGTGGHESAVARRPDASFARLTAAVTASKEQQKGARSASRSSLKLA